MFLICLQAFRKSVWYILEVRCQLWSNLLQCHHRLHYCTKTNGTQIRNYQLTISSRIVWHANWPLHSGDELYSWRIPLHNKYRVLEQSAYYLYLQQETGIIGTDASSSTWLMHGIIFRWPRMCFPAGEEWCTWLILLDNKYCVMEQLIICSGKQWLERSLHMYTSCGGIASFLFHNMVLIWNYFDHVSSVLSLRYTAARNLIFPKSFHTRYTYQHLVENRMFIASY